jgi:PAS domain S-box-containing protein
MGKSMRTLHPEKMMADNKNLENILNSLNEGIIAHDLARCICFFNRAAEEITGFSKEEVLGKDCHKVFGGPLCGRRCSFWEDSLFCRKNSEYPLNIVSKNGEPRQLDMSITEMTDASGLFVGVLARFQDVTEKLDLRSSLGTKSYAGIIGVDIKMLEIFEQIKRLSANDFPVHISGETGTGKELVAKAIHNESRLGSGAFVPVNCGALPEGVLESELFGHVKGAFSGAIRDKKGRFQLADGGTIFLDEVTDLPKHVQVKLLRVLQDGTFEPVGSEKTMHSDIRIISATNRDLKQEVARKRFRKDLFYRLNVVPVRLPPLRERKGDIPLIADHFMRKVKKDNCNLPRIPGETLSVMTDHDWPGNVRELQNAVHHALARSRGNLIRPDDLPAEIRNVKSKRGPPEKLTLKIVLAALEKTGGNKVKAAELLGVGRSTLYRSLAISSSNQ